MQRSNCSVSVVPPIRSSGPIAVVCHDAGASNLLLNWLSHWSESGQLNNSEIRLVVSGPAVHILNQLQSPIKNSIIFSQLDDALSGTDLLISGTGWSSNIEHKARKIAELRGINSIAIVDHWVNYSGRFSRDGIELLPQEIWVSDEFAFDLAKNLFRNMNVTQLPNIYLMRLIERIHSFPIPKDSPSLLYLLEPARNDWGMGIQGEFQGLDFLAQNIHKVVKNDAFKFVLRPHPSESAEKYSEWISKNTHLNPVIDLSNSLEAAIAKSDWVVGLQTYAMVVAHQASKKTYSSLPPHAPKFVLPYSEIKQLRHIL